jgi:2-haloacid dehalogenase
MKPRAIAFDAYGTLFDVQSLVLQASPAIAGDLRALSALWRQRQLEYTWLLSLMGHYEDFWNVTKAALRSAARQIHFQTEEKQLDGLMQAYLSPPIFPDVKPALDSLKGLRLAIL